jgi:hypothetical protein
MYESKDGEDIIYFSIENPDLVEQSFGKEHIRLFGPVIGLTLKCPQGKGKILLDNMGLKPDQINKEN